MIIWRAQRAAAAAVRDRAASADAAAADAAAASRRAEAAEVEVARLSRRLVRGDWDPTRTKVLHRVVNPAAVALASMKRPRPAASQSDGGGENVGEGGRGRGGGPGGAPEPAGALGDNGGGGGGGGGGAAESFGAGAAVATQGSEKRPRRALGDLSTTDAASRGAAAAAAATDVEKMAQRIKEVAKRKIEELRAAVYALFGWRIQMAGAVYTLSSAYAESGEEVLCFGLGERGQVQILDTAYGAALEREIRQYCDQMGSVPALLAHVTMENFEKTTMFGGSGGAR